jgi:hypothetical protein
MTPSEVASRECWLLFWEVLAIVATLLVLAGVVGEHLNDHGFGKWWAATKDAKREKRSSSILIFGLALELVSLLFTTVLAGSLIADMSRKAEEARERAAYLEAKMRPRRLMLGKEAERFENALRGKPTALALVLYAPEVDDAWGLASDLQFQLSRAGWTVPGWPKPLERSTDPVLSDAPPALATHAQLTGVTVVARVLEDDSGPGHETARGAIVNAIVAAFGDASSSVDPSLPDGVLRIIVGGKP